MMKTFTMLYVSFKITWKMKMTRIPIEAYTQNDLSAGKDEEAPTPNATKLVTDVMVIATPA